MLVSDEDDELDNKLYITPIIPMGSSCHESPLLLSAPDTEAEVEYSKKDKLELENTRTRQVSVSTGVRYQGKSSTF